MSDLSSTRERISRIENSLLPETALDQPDAGRMSLAAEMERLRVPNFSIAVVHAGQIEWARGYGVLQAGQPERVDTETLFQAASVSKPLAAAVAMLLVQRGVLTLDEDVNTRLKSWKIPPVGDWQARITLRHLLSHTAGLTIHGFPGYATDVPLPTVPQVLNGEPPANTKAVVVDTLPGFQYRYSGGGTTIVQLLCADVTGTPFPDLARELVFDPLGMTRSRYAQPLSSQEDTDTARAFGYEGEPIVGGWHVYPELAAAGLWTTPTELALFGLELRQAAQGSGRVFEQATAAEMLTPQIEVSPMYSVGLGVYLSGGGDIFWHNGFNRGYKADWMMRRESGDGVVVMSGAEGGFILCQEVMRAVAAEYGWPGYQPPARTRVPMPAEPHYAAYVGVYEARPGYRLEITGHGDGLFLSVNGLDALALTPLTENRFAVNGLKVELEFGIDYATGSVTDVAIEQNKQTLRAKRLS